METANKESRIVYNAPRTESWIVPGVLDRGKNGTYEVIGEMTPSMTQDNLTKKYGLEIPSSALIWAIATKGYELRNENLEEAEKLRQFLKTGFRQYPNTSTRLIYNPSEQDKIIHNYKTSDEYSMNGNVIGPDDLIDKLPDANVLEQILGTKDIAKINEVSQWINGTDFYIWRLNSKPKEKIERVARFYAVEYRLDLYCNMGPHSEDPAFRVLKVD